MATLLLRAPVAVQLLRPNQPTLAVLHMARIQFDEESVARFCREHHIRKLSLFGSVLRDDFRPDSDVDLLVEFEPGREPGLIRLSGMELELSPHFGGRKVDMRTPEDLGHRIRERVVASAEGVYAA